MKAYYDYNVETFGTTSAGGNGILIDRSELYYNGGTTTILPYIKLMYTPYTQFRYDGIMYEGKGIAPDREIINDDGDIARGVDKVLAEALNWIDSEILP